LGKLVCPSEECKWLNDMLLDLAKNLNMSGPVVMSPEGEGDLKSTADNAKKMLERQPWSIVHYAGHSYYNPKTNTGYVFFPGEIEGSIKRVELNRFSDWLRKVTLTYFSSCDSGAGPFVFGLATRRVPNIVGFRWSVCDPLAFEFAKEFYGELFAKRSLERAFLKGRQEMYNRHPDDRIWASPVLIKQLGES